MSDCNLFKDVIAPGSTIVLSFTAIAISWFFSRTQALTAKTKLDFDVFGKRYEIYEATRSLFDRVRKQDHARLHQTEFLALNLKISEAGFFFDRPTQVFLKEVWTVSDRVLLIRDQLEHVNRSSDEAKWSELGQELSANTARLSEMYSQLLPTFVQAMALTQLTK